MLAYSSNVAGCYGIDNMGKARSPMYRVENGLGGNSKEFIKTVQMMYTENGIKYQEFAKPRTIKTSLEFCKKYGIKVYYKEDGWDWSRI
jgi:hypothetical protein